MGLFSKLKHAKSFIKKGAHATASFASKGAHVIHAVNKTADKIANSKLGKAIIDAVPEGRAMYTAVRGTTGALEKGAHTVSSLAKGVEKVAGAKDLKTAVHESEKLHKRGSKAIGDGRHAFRHHKASLEKASSDLGSRMGSDMRHLKRRMKKKMRRHQDI